MRAPALLRSMLFVPGDQARTLIRAAVAKGFPREVSVWLRPNALATGLLEDDLLACLLPGIAGIVLPKSRVPAEATLVDGVIRTLERARDMDEGSVRLALLIETPQAVLGAAEMAAASDRVAALVFGADDLAAEMGLQRTASNDEVREARAHVALAAHGSGRDAIDIVHTAVRDLEGLARECREGKALGYTGKQIIHPAQLDAVHAVFSPSDDEIAWARRIIDASRAAPRGVLVVDGRMVDAPIVRQAMRVLSQAERIAGRRGGLS